LADLSASQASKSFLNGELDGSLIQSIADGIQNGLIEYLLLNLETVAAHMRASLVVVPAPVESRSTLSVGSRRRDQGSAALGTRSHSAQEIGRLQVEASWLAEELPIA
jgi:hypothetical protein